MALIYQNKTIKAAVDAKDYLKHKTQELIADKNEEITLHNDVIRSTTLYDDDGTLKIKQNQVPALGPNSFSETKEGAGSDGTSTTKDFWESGSARKNSKEEQTKKEDKKDPEEEEINII